MRDIQGYFSITNTIDIKQGIDISEINDKMSIFISDLMNRNKNLQGIHSAKGYKGYSFSTPYFKNNQKDGICKFEIRTFSKEIAMSFLSALIGYESDFVKVIQSDIKEYSFGGKITRIESITPSVCTIHQKMLDHYNMKSTHRNTYWVEDMNEEIIKESIYTNLESKYNKLTGKNINTNNAIKSIEVLNNMPIAVKYNSKKATLLGNKFKIEFNNGRDAQILARMATVEGLLEKNAILGLGYVKPVYEKVVG